MPSSLRTVCEAHWALIQPGDTSLVGWVAAQRDLGTSWRHIATQLRDLTDGAIDLPVQTLINWTDAAGSQQEPAA